ncbi:phytanoyl-CoA dioxygenase family protein [Thalassobaculum sp.]|uniref:phytanoyl-CoA dioxygenase family protein n=1 Tax=Thalassobaculum sp. TaxID=2022740 RepID=UPI0032ED2DF7
MPIDIDMTAPPQFGIEPEEARAFYLRHGFLIELDVWSDAECERLNAAALAFPGPEQGDFTPLMHPHRTDPIFLEALRSHKVVALMEGLMSAPLSGLQTEYFFGVPGTSGFSLHQDNYYIEAKPEVFASVWSALTDVSPEKGGLVIYPGTNREPILPTRRLPVRTADHNQDPNAANEECVVPPAYTPIDVSLPRGAVVVLHGHLVHGSHQNRTTLTRNALLSTYIVSGERFRPGSYSKRTEVPLH